MKIKLGTTRIVILICGLAFKIPRIGRYDNFLRGLLGNWTEARYNWPVVNPIYCPVLFSLPLGLLVVMPRCEALKSNDIFEICDGEYKRDSYGKLNDRIVCIDYGEASL